MSLVLSPLLFFALGLGVARLSKARRVWRRHHRIPYTIGGPLLMTGYLVLGSLFVDLAWVQPLVGWLPASSGTDWMINSGFLSFDASWPLADPGLLLAVILVFAAFPLWYALGVVAGYWLFGRSPKQTGIIGLLR